MRGSFGVVVTAALIFSGALSGAGQTPARDNPVSRTSTALLQGRVVEANSEIGLVRAIVTVSGATLGREGRSVTTDELGRYAFDGLAAGRYTLQATKAGYVTLGPGQRRPLRPSRTIEIADGQILPEASIALPRAGVIVVRITNAYGEPLALHSITVQEYSFVNGQRMLEPAPHGREAGKTVRGAEFTNDLGQARIHGLAPGEYYVSALSGSMSVLARTGDESLSSEMYFPGTHIASEARPVVVVGGQETEVSFQLPLSTAQPARRVRVSGVVRSSNGAAATNATLSTSATSSYVPILPDGSFEMTNIGSGEHKMTVRAGQGPGEVEEWGRATVRVQDEDVSGVTVYTMRTGTLRGRFVFDAARLPSDLPPGALQLAVLTTPESFGPLPDDSRWNDDWTFEINRLAGPYVLRLREPTNGWHLKAIIREGRDVTDLVEVNGSVSAGELQVVVTRGTTLTGAAVDSRNRAVAEYVAVVFPEDSNRWRESHSRSIAASRSNQQGEFRITGLPPGRYLVAAVEYLESGEERDPDVLRQISQDATALTIEEGESKAVSLRVSTY